MDPTTIYHYTAITLSHANALEDRSWRPSGMQACDKVATAAMSHAVRLGHPLLVMADALVQLAHVHVDKFDSPIAEDYVLGPEWLKAVEAVGQMLNGDYGPIDAGTVSSILQEARGIAGFGESE